jgi:hypothetical protein
MTISYLVVSYSVVGKLLERKYKIQDDIEGKLKLNRKMFKILPVLVVLGFLILEGLGGISQSNFHEKKYHEILIFYI